MFEAYKIGVTLSLTNKVSTGLLLISKQAYQAQGAIGALQTKLNNMKETGKKAAYELGGAFTIAAPFALAIADAAKLQKEIIGIQSVTRGTTVEMDRMRTTIEKVAGQTVFSSIDVAKMGKTIAAGTGLDAKSVTSLLPEYAKFADVQYILKGTPYEKSTLDAVRLAHTAGHYDPESLGRYLDLLTKASFIVPGGLGEVGNALKYSQGIAKNALGVDDNNTVLMTALLNRLGLSGSRGGTSLLAAMSRSIPGVFGSGLLTGKSASALRAMGMTDAGNHATFFRDGKFDTFTWIKQLSDYVAREFATHPEALARQDIAKNFQFAFGTNGGKVAALLSNPAALEQLTMISKAFNEGSGTAAIQGKFADESVWQKFENARTNFTSAMTELGWVLLPAAATALTALNNGLATLTTFLHDNPRLVKALSFAFLGLAGALAFAGTVNLLKFAFMGLAIPMKLLTSPLSALAAMPLAGIAGGLTLLASALVPLAALAYHKEIADKIDAAAPGVGDFLMKSRDFLSGMKPAAGGNHSFAPPPSSGQTIVVQHTSNLDGRPIYKSTTQYQTNDASGPPTGPSGFDGRMTPSYGGSGSW